MSRVSLDRETLDREIHERILHTDVVLVIGLGLAPHLDKDLAGGTTSAWRTGRLQAEDKHSDLAVDPPGAFVAQLYGEIAQLRGHLAERDRTIEWLHREVAQRDETIRQQQHAINQLHVGIAHQDQAGERLCAEPTGPADSP